MSSDGTLVDWGLAARTAATVAGDGDLSAGGLDPQALRETCSDALTAAREYTGLEAPAPPAAEIVGREEWSRVALATLRSAAEEIEANAADGLAVPGPLGVAARRVAGAATGLEAGVATGYAARRVLGQYDVALVGDPRPPRLLLVGANLEATRRELEADREPFLRWIALHESTHVLQFQGVAWLESHVRELVRDMLAGAAQGLDLGRLGRRLLSSDPRRLVRSALRGELARALLGEAQRAQLDRLQATMAAIEGHAEHVTEACAGALDRRTAELGARIAARRERRGGLSEILARLLGFEMKLRQYRLGKAFCDAVADEAGRDGVARLWRSPECLPTLEELGEPSRWLGRVSEIGAAAP
jgi:coenzyme F420 biosynthesis associated uncharacterized protein